MEIKSGSEWVDDKSGLDVVVESIIAAASEETKVVYKLFDNTGNYLGYNSCTHEAFLVSKTPKEYIYEYRYSKGYEHGMQHMKMQNSIDKYLEVSDNLSLTEQEFESIINEAFEEGYAQAYSEIQTKTERERALQEKAWDEGYDQAIDDLIEAGVIGEEEYLDEDCSEDDYSEYEFGDVEDDEEEYCFSKELDKILNGEFTSSINFDGNKKDTSILDEYNRGYEDGKSRGITLGYNKRDYATSKPLEGCDGTERKHSHYFKDVRHLDYVDIYQVCKLFPVDDDSGAITHARKKLLVAGGRGAGKDMIKDITEARDTLNRYLQIEGIE